MAGLDRTSKNSTPSKFAFLKEALQVDPSGGINSLPVDLATGDVPSTTASKSSSSLMQADIEQAADTSTSSMKFDQIKDRKVDTRPLDPAHVDQLAESIAVLGLLEPLVVDAKGVLLAGAHRKSAIAQIQEQAPDAYDNQFPREMIPVRVMAFDAEQEPDLALQIEISENEKRRDYTPSEIRALAERLRESGYTDVPGRPAKGERRLRPAIEVIVGKSLRQVRRILNEDEKTRTHVRVSNKQLILSQLESVSERWLDLPASEKQEESDEVLSKHVSRLLKLVRVVITQELGSD
jgi:ParB family transcriptional regulator, chromosome partitioning protein